MKYDHIVKYNGTFYQTGTEVPVKVEKTQDEIDTEKADKIKSVKTMKRDELDAFAIENGIAIEDTDTVETLKAKIISVISK